MAKYIKLEELMKFPIRRNHYDKEHGSEDFIYGIETVLEYAENLQTTDIVQEWISADDRLPENGGYVVCIAKRNPFSRFMPMVARIEKNGWVNPITDQYISEVTHWMPMPHPPKGE